MLHTFTKPSFAQSRQMARTKIYLTEHMNAAGITDEAMAAKLKCSRHTVLRARQKPEKVTVKRLQAFADALGLEDWKDLTYPPDPAQRLSQAATEANEELERFRSGPK